MDAAPIIPPPDDDFEPSQPARPGRLRRSLFQVLGLLLAMLAAVVGAAAWSPAFYRARLPAGGPLAGRDPAAARVAAEQAARRLVTTVSAMHADFLRVGRWEGLLAEQDVNAWLATDLPRNHADILPVAVLDPRVEFLPGRLRAGVRLGRGLLSTTCWIEAEVSLREPNQLGIRLLDARLGGLPVPRGPILRELARRLERLGTVTQSRWQDGRGLLVVYIPSTHQAGGMSHWLEAVRFATGELALAGETRQGAVRIDEGR